MPNECKSKQECGRTSVREVLKIKARLSLLHSPNINSDIKNSGNNYTEIFKMQINEDEKIARSLPNMKDVRKSLIPRPVRFSNQQTNWPEPALFKSKIPRRIVCHPKKKEEKQNG